MSDQDPNGLPYEGFDPKYDIEVDKETGCFMKGAFTMPESDWCFLYHDKKYHFWFYADRIWEGRLYDVSVRRTSNGKLYRGGGVPAIKVIDLPVIKRNMEKVFPAA